MQPAVIAPMPVAAPASPPLATVDELPPDKPEGAYKRLGSNALRTRAVKRLAIAPDGDFIATLNINDELEVWSVKTRRRVWMRGKDNGGMGDTLAFSSDGKLLATGGLDSDVRLLPERQQALRCASVTLTSSLSSMNHHLPWLAIPLALVGDSHPIGARWGLPGFLPCDASRLR